ncbi:MAG: methyltransferase domain-containing protein, partial [Actinomycetota bacterium]
RPAYASELADWVEAAPELADRLRSGGRIVDIGCGGGWSTIALARAFPEAEVVGIDADAASIDDAVANAAATAPDVDIRFELLDASDPIEEYGADLVLILEALHDMARPAEALEAARRILADGGAVLVADEKVSPTFVAPGDELERMMYGWSVSHCLPVAMAEEPSAAIGTVIRPSTVKALAREAGFASTELSDIDAGFFNLYVLRP